MTQLRDKKTTRLTLQRQGVKPCRRGHIGCRGSGRGDAGPCGGDFCDGPHITVGPLERRGDCKIAQLLRSDRETGLSPEPADDVVDRGAGQAMPFAGPIEIDKQRTGLGAAASSQAARAAPVGSGKATGSFSRSPPTQDGNPVPWQVDILDVEPYRLAAAQAQIVQQAQQRDIAQPLWPGLRAGGLEHRAEPVTARPVSCRGRASPAHSDPQGPRHEAERIR